MTTVRYFAGAAEAAGRDEERVVVASVRELREQLANTHRTLGPVLAKCSLLVNGQRVDDPSFVLASDDRVDVLPPFAGG